MSETTDNTADHAGQRPLAAVVLGGLVTSTALTLIVLPVIYSMVEGRTRRSATG